MSVEINITYKGGLRCAATHAPSRQRLATDAPVDNGGQGATFSPTDLVATALGTCMATIMGLVAKRNNLNITGLQIQVIKEMTADSVRPYRLAQNPSGLSKGDASVPRRPRKVRGGSQCLPGQTESARGCEDSGQVRVPQCLTPSSLSATMRLRMNEAKNPFSLARATPGNWLGGDKQGPVSYS